MCDGVEYGRNMAEYYANSRPDFSDSLMPALPGEYLIHALIHLEILESSSNQGIKVVIYMSSYVMISLLLRQ